jgi:hypothetical protein
MGRCFCIPDNNLAADPLPGGNSFDERKFLVGDAGTDDRGLVYQMLPFTQGGTGWYALMLFKRQTYYCRRPNATSWGDDSPDTLRLYDAGGDGKKSPSVEMAQMCSKCGIVHNGSCR